MGSGELHIMIGFIDLQGDQASMSSSHHRQTMDLDAALTSPGAEDTGNFYQRMMLTSMVSCK